MIAGFETYGPDAKLIVSVTDRIGRQIGSITLPPGSGSLAIDPSIGGTPYFFFQPLEQGFTYQNFARYATVTGRTINWVNGANQCMLVYGVY